MMSGRSRLMRMVGPAVIAILVAATTACVAQRSSRSPHLWQLHGVVVAIHDSSVRVRHKSGQIVVLALDRETAYAMHNEPASPDQLRVGRRVIIDVLRSGGVDRAVLVRVF